MCERGGEMITCNKIVIDGTTPDGTISSCSISIEQIEASKEYEKNFLALKKELRSLVRSKENLEEAIFTLHELVDLSYAKNSNSLLNPISKVHKGLLSFSIIRYRACFVKDNNGNIPLNFLISKLKDSIAHKILKDLGDKYYGHLDDNHDVRFDDVKWSFQVKDNSVISRQFLLTGSGFDHFSKEGVQELITHMGLIIEMINEKLLQIDQELFNKINVSQFFNKL